MTMGNEGSGGPLRAGIIGCGGRGHAHAEGYAEDERVEIAACADPSEEARNALAERFGVAGTWADYGEMLDREDLDLVSVCTWPHLHRPMIEAAAEACGAGPFEGVFHRFTPLGVTGAGTAASTSICAHTWPEHGYAAVDIFSCSERFQPQKAALFLKDKFHAAESSTTELARGVLTELVVAG